MGKLKFNNDGMARAAKCALLELTSIYSLLSTQLLSNVFHQREMNSKGQRDEGDLADIFSKFIGPSIDPVHVFETLEMMGYQNEILEEKYSSTYRETPSDLLARSVIESRSAETLYDMGAVYAYCVLEYFLKTFFGLHCFSNGTSKNRILQSAREISDNFEDYLHNVERECRRAGQPQSEWIYFDSTQGLEDLSALAATLKGGKGIRNQIVHDQKLKVDLTKIDVHATQKKLDDIILTIERFVIESAKLQNISIEGYSSVLKKAETLCQY